MKIIEVQLNKIVYVLTGKKLVCCETAWNDFEKILETLGGPMEKKRTVLLKEMITVYPDDFGGR